MLEASPTKHHPPPFLTYLRISADDALSGHQAFTDLGCGTNQMGDVCWDHVRHEKNKTALLSIIPVV